MNEKFTEAIRLMKSDLAYSEEKYQGKFLELPHNRARKQEDAVCQRGDIRFNVVGEAGWAVKAERKGQAGGDRKGVSL